MIMQQKLFKEVENAIRASDIDDKDCLDIREFKQCLFNLSYCATLQMKEQSNEYRVAISQNSTAVKILRKEEDFVHNLWELLNPSKEILVPNALVFDILVHLSLDLTSIKQTSEVLRSYLEDTYSQVDFSSIKRSLIEQNSQLFESNELVPSSLEQQEFQHLRAKEREIFSFQNLLNAFLEGNCVWTVERIVNEFKSIHAHKVADLQKNVRARSPSPNSSLQLGLLGDITDKRKFKEGVVEQHFQNHTFVPALSEKTKQLDQQQISKLIGKKPSASREASNSPQLKRFELLFYK